MTTEMKSDLSLDVINIASPCNVSWDTMDGDDRVRFCSQCELNVYELTHMSREEAEELVFQREGRLCVRFYRRADGTVLTKDCPVGMRTLRRQLARAITGIAAMIAFLTCGLVFGGEITRRPGYDPGPLTRFAEWINPHSSCYQGDVVAPVAPTPPPPGTTAVNPNPPTSE